MKRTAGTLYLSQLCFYWLPATRHRNSPNQGFKWNLGSITIDVKTRPLLGERIYVPQVTVTNGSDLPITITSVELAAKQGTYANKPDSLGAIRQLCRPVRLKRSTSGSTSPMTLGKLFFDSRRVASALQESRSRRNRSRVSYRWTPRHQCAINLINAVYRRCGVLDGLVRFPDYQDWRTS